MCNGITEFWGVFSLQGPGIGSASLSTFGFVGAALEIILIFYLMVSSVVGFYSLRFFGNFTPKKDDTTMTKIIGNCVSILVLSSALPVMSRTLGITRFDLLGDFGRFNWLGNFYIVLSYNLLFAIMTTLCLIRKFTSAVREELFKALGLHKLHLSDTSRDSETTKPSANGHQKALWDLTASVALYSKSRQLIHDIPIDSVHSGGSGPSWQCPFA